MTLPSATPAPAMQDFDRFYNLVISEPALMEKLRAAPGRDAFKALAVELGRTHGLNFTEAEVQLALDGAKRTWLERRIG
jgi:hypothetical protein